MIKISLNDLTSNLHLSNITGYCVDLLMELAKIMDFEFEIVPSDRNQYGKKNPDGLYIYSN